MDLSSARDRRMATWQHEYRHAARLVPTRGNKLVMVMGEMRRGEDLGRRPSGGMTMEESCAYPPGAGGSALCAWPLDRTRDIKPANIIDSRWRAMVKLLDFGLAGEAWRSGSGPAVTIDGAWWAQMHDIAPEHIPASARCPIGYLRGRSHALRDDHRAGCRSRARTQ